MKRAIILLLACCLLLPACTAAESDTPKTETAGETVTSAELPTSTAVETTEETETTETAEITVTVETDAKSSHYEDMQMIYETLPLLGHLTRTTDYIYEYYTRFFAERHRKEPDEEQWRKLMRHYYTIDPFSEAMYPNDTPNQIAAGMTSGELIDRYGYPNYSLYWGENVGYRDDAPVGYQMHAYWFLEDGSLMQVIFDAYHEKDNPADFDSATSFYESWGRNGYRVRETNVLTVRELLDLKEFYKNIADSLEWNWSIEELNPHGINWTWDEWPEIFVTKYGME